jgi:hypothetical protein
MDAAAKCHFILLLIMLKILKILGTKSSVVVAYYHKKGEYNFLKKNNIPS